MPMRPRSRNTCRVRQRKSWLSSSALGHLNWRLGSLGGRMPDIPGWIALSLPAASIACKFSSSA